MKQQQPAKPASSSDVTAVCALGLAGVTLGGSSSSSSRWMGVCSRRGVESQVTASHASGPPRCSL